MLDFIPQSEILSNYIIFSLKLCNENPVFTSTYANTKSQRQALT